MRPIFLGGDRKFAAVLNTVPVYCSANEKQVSDSEANKAISPLVNGAEPSDRN